MLVFFSIVAIVILMSEVAGSPQIPEFDLQSPEGINAAIGNAVLEGEMRRVSVLARDLKMGGLQGPWNDVWQSIAASAQDTKDGVQQEGMQQLLAMLPDRSSQRAALKAANLSAGQWWFGYVTGFEVRTGKKPPRKLVELAQQRVHSLQVASEALDAEEHPQSA